MVRNSPRIVSGGARYQPSCHVLVAEAESLVVLLSLKTGRYFSLDDLGAEIWRHVARGATVDDVCKALERDDNSEAALREDVRAIVAGLLEAGLLECIGTSPDSKARYREAAQLSGRVDAGSARLPSPITCFVLLAVFDLALRVLPLHKVIRFAYGKLRTGHAIGPDHQFVRQLRSLVESVAVFYPIRAECLERSLTFLFLLRRSGMDAALRIGVDPFPFEAHAWVEHSGRSLTEPEEAIIRFVKFPAVTVDVLWRVA
jgi:hypothetical protein